MSRYLLFLEIATPILMDGSFLLLKKIAASDTADLSSVMIYSKMDKLGTGCRFSVRVSDGTKPGNSRGIGRKNVGQIKAYLTVSRNGLFDVEYKNGGQGKGVIQDMRGNWVNGVVWAPLDIEKRHEAFNGTPEKKSRSFLTWCSS